MTGPRLEHDPNKSVEQVTEFDVECRRGGEEPNRGTKTYWRLVEDYHLSYKNATRKEEKNEIVEKIIEKLGPGRFIIKVNKEWYQLKDYSSKEKVSHALRNQDLIAPDPMNITDDIVDEQRNFCFELREDVERIRRSNALDGQQDNDMEDSQEQKLGQFDISCGRGGGTNNHCGNRVFRWLIGEYLDEYDENKKKRSNKNKNNANTNANTLLVLSIYRALQAKRMRFLKSNVPGGGPRKRKFNISETEATAEKWFRLKNAQALAKIRQAFKDASTNETEQDVSQRDELHQDSLFSPGRLTTFTADWNISATDPQASQLMNAHFSLPSMSLA